MNSKWIVRTGALLILLGYVLPSVTVSCSAMPGVGQTFSIYDMSNDEPLLFLIPISGLAILALAFLNPQNQAQTSRFFWGQLAAVGVSMISILVTMASVSNQVGQYGLEVSPEAGIFVLILGYLGVGGGLILQWMEMNRDSPVITQKVFEPFQKSQPPPQPDLPKTLPASPAVQGVRLELVSGHYSKNMVPVLGTDFSIGRGANNDLVLPDPEVSREHVRLRSAQGAWFIQDQGSKAGISLNGCPVRAARMQSGDEITIGDTTFKFKDV